MTDSWLEFTYRDFYDVPRCIVTEIEERVLLLDCPFDHDAGEYPAIYQVYEIPRELLGSLPNTSWVGLHDTAECYVGELSVSAVAFDHSRRKLINGNFVDLIGPS